MDRKIIEEKTRRALMYSLGGITGIGAWSTPEPHISVIVKDEESKVLVEKALSEQLGELRQIDGRPIKVRVSDKSTPVLY